MKCQQSRIRGQSKGVTQIKMVNNGVRWSTTGSGYFSKAPNRATETAKPTPMQMGSALGRIKQQAAQQVPQRRLTSEKWMAGSTNRSDRPASCSRRNLN